MSSVQSTSSTLVKFPSISQDFWTYLRSPPAKRPVFFLPKLLLHFCGIKLQKRFYPKFPSGVLLGMQWSNNCWPMESKVKPCYENWASYDVRFFHPSPGFLRWWRNPSAVLWCLFFGKKKRKNICEDSGVDEPLNVCIYIYIISYEWLLYGQLDYCTKIKQLALAGKKVCWK